jgi:hypothetical protein
MRNAIDFGVRNPRRNLPINIRHKRTEVIFQNAFIRAWREQLDEPGIGGSQFELPGYGIADYLWISACGRLDAFEFKISNWRKGATQASKYRCYANRAFLVLPPDIAKTAINFIDQFKAINIGLYSFDKATGHIEIHFHPCETKPLIATANRVAMFILSRKRKFRNLCEAN